MIKGILLATGFSVSVFAATAKDVRPLPDPYGASGDAYIRGYNSALLAILTAKRGSPLAAGAPQTVNSINYNAAADTLVVTSSFKSAPKVVINYSYLLDTKGSIAITQNGSDGSGGMEQWNRNPDNSFRYSKQVRYAGSATGELTTVFVDKYGNIVTKPAKGK